MGQAYVAATGCVLMQDCADSGFSELTLIVESTEPAQHKQRDGFVSMEVAVLDDLKDDKINKWAKGDDNGTWLDLNEATGNLFGHIDPPQDFIADSQEGELHDVGPSTEFVSPGEAAVSL
eukprot:gb/GFBE01007757.1/.p1 GENE.gb/GFBE01007757.1/~~gb/GFBE01007757.1/.p1  ORF type:complete len:120 (+),score=24.52 gb/GFBE01007757.1/:1-360(+)